MQRDGFIDYYEVLQISPNARQETIQRVYRLLAQLYHPDNLETGDMDQFNLVLEAFRTLIDPEQRASYDVHHSTMSEAKWRIFNQSSGVQGLEAEKRKRIGILSLLCTKRINEPHSPTLNLVDLEQFLGCPREHLELSLWYLRESGRIQRNDNGRYYLTAKGLELLEENMETVSETMRLLKAPEPARS